MDSYSIKLPRTQPEAVFSSFISGCGDLKLPEGCLTEIAESKNSSDSIVVTNSWEEGIICLYTLDAFDQLRVNLNKLNVMDTSARRIKRRIIGESMNVSIDEKRHVKVDLEFLDRLGFDTNQDTVNEKAVFPVMMLKYPDRIEIASIDVYKTIIDELNKQQIEE